MVFGFFESKTKKNNSNITSTKKNKQKSIKTKKVNCSNFVIYRKKVVKTSLFGKSETYLYDLKGLKGSKPNTIREIISKNKFKDTETVIPPGYRKVKVNNNYVNKYYCDNKLSNSINNKTKKVSLPKNAKSYLIHDNGGRPFKVVIYKSTSNKQIVDIYKIDDILNNKLTYNTKIISYIPTKIFIGKSPKNEMTSFSAGYGPKFDGNSILLCLNDKTNEYVYIGEEIYSFKAKNTIKTYVSPVGNNDVPYPYAIDNSNNYYLMTENTIINMNNISDKKILNDPYEYYYNNEVQKQLKLQTLKLKTKIIQKKL